MPAALRLTLASGSRGRRYLLERAGYDFDVLPADIDELGVRRELVAVLPAAEAAKERQALSDVARQSVEILQAR